MRSPAEPAAEDASPAAGEQPEDPRAVRIRALEGAVDQMARSWARERMRETAHAGRRVQGGWPGTLSEAKARTLGCARAASSALALTVVELTALSRRANAVARATWLSAAGSTPDD